MQQGDQVTFGGWAYLESGAASDLGWLLQAENSSQQGIAWYAAAPKAASAGWVFQSATYTVPAGVSYVALYAQIWQATAASVLRVDDGFLTDDRLSVTTVQNLDYLPFGELNSSDSSTSTHKFTGDERDSETSLDHTWFRQYSSQFARWSSPDPAGLAAVDPSNPQSWNRYAYVGNNPMNFLDPFGLYQCPTAPLYDGSCLIFGGGGLGPGGMTCTQDSVVTDCGTVFNNLNMGTAQPCANNNCFGQTAFTSNSAPPGTTLLPGGGAIVTNGYCIDTAFPTTGASSSNCTITGINVLGAENGNSGGVHGQAYYFFKDFSLFGPKNDPRPSCFAGFVKNTVGNFFGYSGADVAGGAASATYILTPPSPVPPTMALRGGKYTLNWIKADQAARVSNAAYTGLAVNLVFAESLALGSEVDSALNGNCK